MQLVVRGPTGVVRYGGGSRPLEWKPGPQVCRGSANIRLQGGPAPRDGTNSQPEGVEPMACYTVRSRRPSPSGTSRHAGDAAQPAPESQAPQ